MAIRIVTDSSADLPPHLTQRWDITVLPCYVIFDDQTYRDGADITADDFYLRLVASPRLPTTAQPSVADFQSVYHDLLGQGHEIISIHISGKLSGTLNSAHQARAALGDEDASRVEIVDSQLASIPLGLVVLAASRQAEDANSHQVLAEKVSQDLPLAQCYFAVDTLEYLRKGGRIGKAQAFIGSILNVKPILSIRDGEAHPVERPRNRERALRRLVELTRERSPHQQLAVIHSTDPEQAEKLLAYLSDLLPPDQVVAARFGPTLGTYLGPRALGVAMIRANDIPSDSLGDTE